MHRVNQRTKNIATLPTIIEKRGIGSNAKRRTLQTKIFFIQGAGILKVALTQHRNSGLATSRLVLHPFQPTI
jgi:hypothetical protein